jgi:hypothetical protein
MALRSARRNRPVREPCLGNVTHHRPTGDGSSAKAPVAFRRLFLSLSTRPYHYHVSH